MWEHHNSNTQMFCDLREFLFWGAHNHRLASSVAFVTAQLVLVGGFIPFENNMRKSNWIFSPGIRWT